MTRTFFETQIWLREKLNGLDGCINSLTIERGPDGFQVQLGLSVPLEEVLEGVPSSPAVFTPSLPREEPVEDEHPKVKHPAVRVTRRVGAVPMSRDEIAKMVGGENE